MASAAIQAEYIQDSLEFTQDLAENGRLASFGNYTDGTERRQSTVYDEVGTSYILQNDWNKNFSEDVQSEDVFYFVEASTDLDGWSLMQLGGNMYTIVLSKPFKPDGITTIFYEIQARA